MTAFRIRNRFQVKPDKPEEDRRPMKLQVLLSTIDQTDHGVVERMNLRSDAVVVNQCSQTAHASWERDGKLIEWFDFAERGVGLSRNNALLRATGDILLFADDDIRYAGDYARLVEDEFRRHPRADAILFNFNFSDDGLRSEYVNRRFRRVRIFNCLRYGAVRIAVKRKPLQKRGIMFSTLFGGGTRHGSGEDSLFIVECLRKGLKIYASPRVLGEADHAQSTWFSGYTEKYFLDKGALFACISDRLAGLLCLQYCLRHHECFQSIPRNRAFALMLRGVREFRDW